MSDCKHNKGWMNDSMLVSICKECYELKSDIHIAQLEAELAELRVAVGMAMESHTVDGYVNWDNVAALLPTPEEPT